MQFNQTNNNAGAVVNVTGAVKHCGTCKFWGSKEPDENPTFRQCMAIAHDKDGYIAPSPGVYDPTEDSCDFDPNDPFIVEIIDLRKKSLAVTQDGSGYFAALKVREDFGCILHEDA